MVIRYPPQKVFEVYDEQGKLQELVSHKDNNVYVFQASGKTDGCNSVYDGEPVEGVQLNWMPDYLKNYGPGRMWIRQLRVPLTEEEEKIVHKFVESSCKGHIPYCQDPENLWGACWFNAFRTKWTTPTSELHLTQTSYFCSELVLKTLQQVPSLQDELGQIKAHKYAPQAAEELLLDKRILKSERRMIYNETDGPLLEGHSRSRFFW